MQSSPDPLNARVPFHFRTEIHSFLCNSFLALFRQDLPIVCFCNCWQFLTFPAPHHLGDLSGWAWIEDTCISFPLGNARAWTEACLSMWYKKSYLLFIFWDFESYSLFRKKPWWHLKGNFHYSILESVFDSMTHVVTHHLRKLNCSWDYNTSFRRADVSTIKKLGNDCGHDSKTVSSFNPYMFPCSPVATSTKAWLRLAPGAVLMSLTESQWKSCQWWLYRYGSEGCGSLAVFLVGPLKSTACCFHSSASFPPLLAIPSPFLYPYNKHPSITHQSISYSN